jgi:hypothetical protein
MPDFTIIERELGVRLPLALAEFEDDSGYWEPIDPAQVLDADSSALWGGQMLPDSIPVLNNGCGDCILARFKPNGLLREFVQWDHEGGLWRPSDFMDGPSASICAAYRDAEEALNSGLLKFCLSETGTWGLADALEVPLSRVQAWVSDTSLIDPTSKKRIRKLTNMSDEALFFQDWEKAASAALSVSAARPDLAWPGTLLGRANERSGHVRAAVCWYEHSLLGLDTTSGFTDDWREIGDDTPYSVARLRSLLDSNASLRSNAWQVPLSSLEMRERWMERGKSSLAADQAAEAYEYFFRAGWDRLFTNGMIDVLEHLARAANAAGSRPLAALARLHLESCRRIESPGDSSP